MTAPQDPFSTPSSSGRPGSGEPDGGYGAPPPPPYGAPSASPPPYGAPVGGHGGSPKNGFGTAALVLGVLALLTSLFFGGIVFGIPAIVFGALGLGRVKKHQATNRGASIAGLVLGAVSLLITAGIIAFGVSLLNSEQGKDYQDCLREAAGDRAAIERCAQDFSEEVAG